MAFEKGTEQFDLKWIPEPYSGCWLWTGAVTGSGYGAFRKESVHRFSFRIHKSNIPMGSQVLHKCDTPLCVNPDHLFLGTQKDNITDCQSKGRNVRRSNHGMAKLNDAKVCEIRKSGLTNAALAREFGVGIRHIFRIKSMERWK